MTEPKYVVIYTYPNYCNGVGVRRTGYLVEGTTKAWEVFDKLIEKSRYDVEILELEEWRDD